MSANELLILLDQICLAVMAVCTVITCLHVESYMQKMASYTSMIITFCSLGFLFKAEASTLEALVIGQRIVYCMTPHAMFSMLLFILAYCDYHIPKSLTITAIVMNLIVSFMAITVPYNQLFYKELWAVETEGSLVLEKQYAFGHTFAVVLIVIYAIAALSIAIKFTVDNRDKKKSCVWQLIVVVFVPIIAYIIPKLAGIDNNMQPLAFTIFIVLVVFMIYRNNLYDVDNVLAKYSVASIQDAVVIIDKNNNYKAANKAAEDLFPELKNAPLDKDIRYSIAWFADVINGKVTDYEKDDEKYNITIRSIESDNKLQGRVIWFDNVTLQRNYMDLLQKQKANLESEVVTLSDISYRDELTGLNNRRRYEETIDEVRTTGDISEILVGMFDVNGLKITNDTIGHVAGDELIKGAGSIIDSIFCDEGMTFRIGGDEYFAIIHGPKKTVNEYIEELRMRMSEWKGERIDEISIAYGFASGNDYPDKNIDELSIIADRAMYEQKKEYHKTHRKTDES